LASFSQSAESAWRPHSWNTAECRVIAACFVEELHRRPGDGTTELGLAVPS
jgi:hypothetical protein